MRDGYGVGLVRAYAVIRLFNKHELEKERAIEGGREDGREGGRAVTQTYSVVYP